MLPEMKGSKNEVKELDRALLRLEATIKRVRSRVKKLKTRVEKLVDEMEKKRYWIDFAYVRGYGPYYRVRWMENGKVKCRYLGRSPDLPKELENRKDIGKAVETLAKISEEAGRIKTIVEKAEKALQEIFNSP